MQYILQSYKEKIYRFYFTSFHNAIGINVFVLDIYINFLSTSTHFYSFAFSKK